MRGKEKTPWLTQDYVEYLRSRISSGWIREEDAIEGIRNRNVEISVAHAKRLLSGEVRYDA